MTELERRIAEIQADMNSINVDKARAEKINEDLMNQVNILDLLIGSRISRGEDISELLSKKDGLIKELEANNDRLENILDRLKEVMIKSMKLLGNIMF